MKTLIKSLSILLFFIGTVTAQIRPIERVKINYGPLISGYNVPLDTVIDDKYSELVTMGSGWQNNYKHGQINDFIRLAVYDTLLLTSKFNYKFLIRVDAYNIKGQHSNFNVTIPLSYDPDAYRKYNDKSVYQFKNAHKFVCTILSVTDATTNATVSFSNLKKKFTIQSAIQIERYFKSSYEDVVATSDISVTRPQNGKIAINWNATTVKAPSEFELEWLHIDNYGFGYTQYLADYTIVNQEFNNANNTEGWYNANNSKVVNVDWGVTNGYLYFNNGSPLNFPGMPTVAGRTYRLTANIKEITPTKTINLIIYNPFPSSTTVTSNPDSSRVSMVFTAAGNSTNIAIEGFAGTNCKIESVTLVDITYETSLYNASTGIYMRHPEKLGYKFSQGATRVRIPTTSYQIDDVYESGYLLFRVRRVRPDSVQFKFEKFSPWSDYALSTNTVNSYPNRITVGAHTGDTLNWNYLVSYMEEGKRKDVVSYYDGLLKPHQQVAVSNEDNLVIVGETKYDFTGRPAVQVIPSPALKNSGSEYYENVLTYYKGFTQNTNLKTYSASDFDSLAQACPADSAKAISTNSGASKYFSSNNPDKSDLQKFVPDAENYPIVHVEYTPDNTGRIRRQGGVGKNHQLGSGHETFYFYSQPDQNEIDKIFGSEAGNALHYKKTITQDPNGQLSVSITDLQGRVVATALTDENPVNLDAIPEKYPKNLAFDNLTNKNVREANNVVLNYKYTSTSAGPLYIDYRVTNSNFKDSCLPYNLCFKCVYDYEIALINNECNDILFYYKDTIGFLNPNDTVCGVLSNIKLNTKRYLLHNQFSSIDTVSYDSLIKVNNLPQGDYTLVKKLSVNKGAIDMYYNTYQQKAGCLKTFNDFLNSAINALDFSVCDSCDSCATEASYCDGMLMQLKLDVMPGGQYFTFDEDSTVSDQSSILYNSKYSKIKGLYSNGEISLINADSAYKADIKSFIRSYRYEWADSLVRLHPEYPYYLYCKNQLASSHEYDFKRLDQVTNFDDAYTKGFLNPTGVSGIKTTYPYLTAGADPLFISNTALKQAMNSRLLHYKIIGGRNYTIWDFAAYVAFCSQLTDYKEQYACTEAFTNVKVIDSLFFDKSQRDKYYQTFAGIYSSIKMAIVDSLMSYAPTLYSTTNISYPNCKIGGSTCSHYETKIPRYRASTDDGFDHSLSDEDLSDAIQNKVQDGLSSTNDSTCYWASVKWMEALKSCEYINVSNYETIRSEFESICNSGRQAQSPRSLFAVGSAPLSDSLLPRHSIDEVLTYHLGVNYSSKLCNPNLLQNALPYNHSFTEQTINACKCTEGNVIVPPKVEVRPETKDRYRTTCIKDSFIISNFGAGLLAFLNELTDSSALQKNFVDTAFLSYKTYWKSFFTKVIVRTEVVERNYPGALASRSRTEWKLNFLDTVDLTKRCNIFFDLDRTKSHPGAFASIRNKGFFNLKAITEDSFSVQFTYSKSGGGIDTAEIKGVSGCYKVFNLTCVATSTDTLYGTPFMVDSNLFDSFMQVTRSIRRGEAGSLIGSFMAEGDCASSLTETSSSCSLEPSDLAPKLVDALSEALYIGRFYKSDLDNLVTTKSTLFNGNVDPYGFYNFTMEQLSPTYGDYFALSWSRYSGYRGFAFNAANDANNDCYDDKNVYSDPNFIGLSQIGISLESSAIINCNISFGDFYGTGVALADIDSFSNYRFDSVVGYWVVTAHDLNTNNQYTLRVQTCKDKPVCSNLSFASSISTHHYQHHVTTPTAKYTYTCNELNRYYEENHDLTCTDGQAVSQAALDGFMPFYIQRLLNQNAHDSDGVTKNLVNTSTYHSFSSTGMPSALDALIDTNDYIAQYVDDSLLLGYIGNHNSIAKGCQLSLRLLEADTTFTFSLIDSFGRIRPDEEKLNEHLKNGTFEKGKNYFIINAYSSATNGHYKFRGWLSCTPVYDCITPIGTVLPTPETGCGCATCPEVKHALDSFIVTYQNIPTNDPLYPKLVSTFLNKALNNNLSYVEYEAFFNRCKLITDTAFKVKESDIELVGNFDTTCLKYMDGVINRVQLASGLTINYTKQKNTGNATFTVKVNLSNLVENDYLQYKKWLTDSLSAAPCASQISTLNFDTPEPCDIKITFATPTTDTSSCKSTFANSFYNAITVPYGVTLPSANNSYTYTSSNVAANYSGLLATHCVSLGTLSSSQKARVLTIVDSLINRCTYAKYSANFNLNRTISTGVDSVLLNQVDTDYVTRKSGKVACEDIYNSILSFQDSIYKYKPQFIREATLTSAIETHLYNWYGYVAQLTEVADPSNGNQLSICSPNQNGANLLQIMRTMRKNNTLYSSNINLNSTSGLSGNGLLATGVTNLYTGAYNYINRDSVWLTFTIAQGSNSKVFTFLADSFALNPDTIFTFERAFYGGDYRLKLGNKGFTYQYTGTGNMDLLNCCTFAKPTLCFSAGIPTSEEPDTTNYCKLRLMTVARGNATIAYNQYTDSVEHAFKYAYEQNCLDSGQANETIAVGSVRATYHYTLYYYDLSGSLVKTVPPAGVDTLNVRGQIGRLLKRNRENYQTFTHVFTKHKLATTYRYNSLGQVTSQHTPDAGTSTFYYDLLGRLVVSQNSKQQAKGNVYSYTLRDAQNRVTEVGEIANGSLNTDSLKYHFTAYFNNWLQRGVRTQITRTTYDTTYATSINNLFGPDGQQNLRSRVSTVAYYHYNTTNYNYATHYSYDIHGNVDVLIQDYPELEAMANRYKYMYYNYDLISGKVNMVAYQPGQPDRFYHRYHYDADNRLRDVYTSTDSIIWDNDATYNYYKHGPLARVNLGEYNVQGIDYAYTIHGWLKGVNSNTLDSTRDMGQDGHHSNPLNFASDVFGFTLGYYQGDYKPIDATYYNTATSFMANTSGSPLGVTNNNLYNGNISHMVTAVKPLMVNNKPMANIYRYDQLNRITRMETYSNLNNSTNAWNSGSASADYLSTFAYDPNGNIMKLYRAGLSTATYPQMDSLNYNYYAGTNRLSYVNDREAATNYPDDIDNQTANNYGYDLIGNLAKDKAEQIDTILWNVYGKITDIKRTDSSTRPALSFAYDAAGQRVLKVIKNGASENTWQKEYYVRDAQGNIMATYKARSFIANDSTNISAITQWVHTNKGDDSLAALIKTNLGSSTAFHNNYYNVLATYHLDTVVLNKYSLATYLNADNSLGQQAFYNADYNNNSTILSSLVNQMLSYDAGTTTRALVSCNAEFVQYLLSNPTHRSNLLTYMCTNGYETNIADWCVKVGETPDYDCNSDASKLDAFGDMGTLAAGFYDCGVDVTDLLNAAFDSGTLSGIIIDYGFANFKQQLQDCDQGFDYYNFFLSTYDNPAHARQALYAGVSSSYLLNLVHNQSTYLGHAIKANYTKLNQALSPLANFNATIYLGWVQARWGQSIFSSMANSLVYTQQLKLNEQHLYGSSRLGVKTPDTTLFNRDITISGIDSMGQLIVQNILDSSILQIDTAMHYRMLALKQYELSNHLGNVLATVLDRRTMTNDKVLAYATSFTGTLDGWTAGWSAAGTLYNVTPPTTVSLDNNRLQCTATTSMGGVRNVINTSVGVSYTLTLDIDMGTAEGLYIMPRASNGGNIYTGTNLAQVYVTSSGTYAVNFTATTSTTQLLVEKAGAVEKYFFIDNVKVEQSTPTLSSYPIADVINAQYYYPFGSTMKTWKADGEDYRFGFNGQEKDNEVVGDGNSYTADYWQYDARLAQRWNPDPVIKSDVSPYATLGGNPIWYVDPNGDDWYENNNYDPKKEGSQQYVWFEGNKEQSGYKHLGQYLVNFNQEKNSLTVVYQNYEWQKTIDLASDEGAKYRMILAEAGFISKEAYGIDKSGRGVNAERGGGHRETYYGMLIISASIDNRIKVLNNPNNKKLGLAKWFGKGDSYKSIFRASEYNGATELAYTNFWSWKSSVFKAGRTKGDVWSLLGDASLALERPVFQLQTKYNLLDADKILAYAHKNAGVQLFNGKAVSFEMKKTLIQVVNTRTDIDFK